MNLMTRQQIQTLIKKEIEQTEAVMHAEMQSEVPLAELVMHYALGQGGKRFRPLLTLLSAGVCQYHHQYAITAAAFIEFIHNATLLHDDVVDESEMRRGQPTANIAFSNAASVLVGDFLYTRAFQLMVRTGNMAILETMAEATNLIAAGEVMQLSNMHDPDVDEERYYRVIELKTAVLFSAACKVPAQLANLDQTKVQALADYGRYLGLGFQIIDDLLDYTGDVAKLGKSLGDDLAEGKPTLPLIRAQSQLEGFAQKRLRIIIETGDREAINEVIELLNQTDALIYSREQANNMIKNAIKVLDIFSDSDYKTALVSLAYEAIQRDF
ncbi:polyprenyl synthetase family protein [Suttonella ornithocola]|uniref:Octaprenyl-diphosphate synthase n=1 Tax=Suttonella ornithocola TaxID=279832 RepID=A0A380MX73_9GAMM|nr:polyprenyl synthetase family protein [Suttonella ornithocola]SUO96872.1 Octaprenyl-diphosphate synthase [Suttonella ornithocola]